MHHSDDTLFNISGISKYFPSNTDTFKELLIQKLLIIPDNQPGVSSILSAHVTSHINDYFKITTPKGVNCCQHYLSGNGLFIYGNTHLKLEYAIIEVQIIHSITFDIPFTTTIVLPQCLDENMEFFVAPYIEDIYIKKINTQEILITVLLIVDSKISNYY